MLSTVNAKLFLQKYHLWNGSMRFYRWLCSNDEPYIIGDTVEYGNVNSQYYKRLVDNGESFINSYDGKRISFIFFDESIRANAPHEIVTQVESAKMKAASSLEREDIFERVRMEFYKEKPSRKRCAFACSSVSMALMWKNDLTHQDVKHVQLVELEAIGDINFAECNEQYLYTSESTSSYEMEKMAHNYWSGKGNRKKELLLEGKFKVTNIIINTKQ